MDHDQLDSKGQRREIGEEPEESLGSRRATLIPHPKSILTSGRGIRELGTVLESRCLFRATGK